MTYPNQGEITGYHGNVSLLDMLDGWICLFISISILCNLEQWIVHLWFIVSWIWCLQPSVGSILAFVEKKNWIINYNYCYGHVVKFSWRNCPIFRWMPGFLPENIFRVGADQKYEIDIHIFYLNKWTFPLNVVKIGRGSKGADTAWVPLCKKSLKLTMNFKVKQW
jgi:hypothetical protein